MMQKFLKGLINSFFERSFQRKANKLFKKGIRQNDKTIKKNR